MIIMRFEARVSPIVCAEQRNRPNHMQSIEFVFSTNKFYLFPVSFQFFRGIKFACNFIWCSISESVSNSYPSGLINVSHMPFNSETVRLNMYRSTTLTLFCWLNFFRLLLSRYNRTTYASGLLHDCRRLWPHKQSKQKTCVAHFICAPTYLVDS